MRLYSKEASTQREGKTAMWPFNKKEGGADDGGKAKKGGGKGFFKRYFGLDRLIGLILVISALAVNVWDPYPVEFVRNKIFDFYQQTKPRDIPEPARKPVTIIDLDEESLNEVGQWPWPRTVVARMVNNLMQMGAVLVAFDIVFAEPDRMNPDGIADAIPGLDKDARDNLKKLPSNDKIFADVIKKSRVVLFRRANQVPTANSESLTIK